MSPEQAPSELPPADDALATTAAADTDVIPALPDVGHRPLAHHRYLVDGRPTPFCYPMNDRVQ